jgi:hypothetical protein
MSDSTLTILVVSIIASLIWVWILYEVIKSASKSKKQTTHLTIQTRLLAELVRRQGVDESKIMEIVNLDKPYFNFNDSTPKP